MKQVQIPEELFIALVKYHILQVEDASIERTIAVGLKNKLDSLAKRELFTEYKTAKTDDAKQAARQKYIASLSD